MSWLENVTVMKRGYGIEDEQELVIETVGVCEGCNACITFGEEYREYEDVLLHDDAFCVKEWVDKNSNCLVAGDEA